MRVGRASRFLIPAVGTALFCVVLLFSFPMFLGRWFLCTVFAPLVAAMGIVALLRTRHGNRLSLLAVGAVVLFGGVAMAIYGWQAERLLTLRSDFMGPQGMDTANRAVWAVLLGGLGAMVVSIVAGRGNLWRSFSWYVWCYAIIALLSFSASELARDRTYDMDHNAFTSVPMHALAVGFGSSVLLVIAALLLNRHALKKKALPPAAE